MNWDPNANDAGIEQPRVDIANSNQSHNVDATSDKILLAEMNAAIGELLTFCEQHWESLAAAVVAKLRTQPQLDVVRRQLVTSAGWPSRARLRGCVNAAGSALSERFIAVLKDCARSSSRAGLELQEFADAVQLVAGEVVPVLVSAFPSDANQLIRLLHALQKCSSVATVIMSRDVFAEGERVLARGKRQLVEAEAKFAGLWESGLLGVLVCDFHGNIREANDGFLKTFGYTQEDLTAGKVRWNEMTPPEWRHLDEDAIVQLTKTGKAHPWEKEYLHKNGARIPILIGVSMLNDVETIAFVLDISERKRADSLRDRSMELEAENRRVQEANRLKGEFLANMSHELRTPLNAITGFAELLLDGDVSPDSPEHGEFLRDILTAGIHLQRVIGDVLDLAKIEAGNLEFHPEVLRVGDIVDEVCAVLRSVATDRQVEIRAEVEVCEVTLDPGRLKQVLYNYLSNALKFSPPGGSVEVSVTEEHEDRFRVEVADHGIGIAPGDIGKLFQEFQQLEGGMAKRHQGTGLGLALTKRLVEAQGGAVGVSSVLGKGSRFYALLPRTTKAAPTEEEVQPLPVAPDAHSILIVEDNLGDRNVLVRTLGEAGYKTHVAGTGGLAISLCETHSFDAVTLDLLLPDMTGLQVLQRLRQTERSRETPVLIVSVVAEQGVVGGFPVHDYLTKPIDNQALVRSLRAATSRRGTGLVLVVDDDPASQRLAEAPLSALGYTVMCVNNGQTGLEFARHTRPVGIILDLLMPRMNGFEFLAQFRQMAAYDDVPVIVWTTKDLTYDDKDRLAGLAQGTLLKGATHPVGLVAELSRLIGQRRRNARVNAPNEHS